VMTAKAIAATSSCCAPSWTDPRHYRYRLEARPSGPQGDGGGYSDCDGWATTCALRRAGSDVLFDGSCAALVESPPVEPPERTYGTAEGNKGLGGGKGVTEVRGRVRRSPAGGPGRRGRASGVAQNHQRSRAQAPSAGASAGRFNPRVGGGVQAARGERILLTHQFTTRLTTVLG